jgi:hypothetical protein
MGESLYKNEVSSPKISASKNPRQKLAHPVNPVNPVRFVAGVRQFGFHPRPPQKFV